MYFRVTIRIIGLLVILFSGTMFIPILISLIYQDGASQAFSKTFFVTIIFGFILWFPYRQKKYELKPREGFFIVVFLWIILGSIGSLPFLFLNKPNLSLTDSFFESFSGLTTTGATILIELDSLPKAILFYRQMLQWIGGMGIIVLTVAILPILGVGGMQLYRAEIPGPLKDNKIYPRIAETAKTLWLIYILLTIICSISLWIVGMPIFDAISHSFSIISIGGFSTHDANIGYYSSPIINVITAIFLIISSCNYNLHFGLLTKYNFKNYWLDFEFRIFIFIQLTLIIICTLMLWEYNVYKTNIETLNKAFFHAISISTTAGFTIDNFSKWPSFLPILLLCSSFIGGCAGSTSGGVKVIRILLLYLQGSRELKRLIHPKAIYTIKLSNFTLSNRILDAIWGFFSAYALIFIFGIFVIISTGIDNLSAFSAMITSLNNLGPGLGIISNNFIYMPSITKWILIIIMLFGRLEIFTLLVLFTPTFWRK
ncbi:Trk system potassium uptake protein TrkH [Serratia symbiotica]|nr:Trk system potassium uptake protein TrkH [Serratia symbiotica]